MANASRVVTSKSTAIVQLQIVKVTKLHRAQTRNEPCSSFLLVQTLPREYRKLARADYFISQWHLHLLFLSYETQEKWMSQNFKCVKMRSVTEVLVIKESILHVLLYCIHVKGYTLIREQKYCITFHEMCIMHCHFDFNGSKIRRYKLPYSAGAEQPQESVRIHFRSQTWKVRSQNQLEAMCTLWRYKSSSSPSINIGNVEGSSPSFKDSPNIRRLGDHVPLTLDLLNPQSVGFDICWGLLLCQVSSPSDQRFSFYRANMVHTKTSSHRHTYTMTNSSQYRRRRITQSLTQHNVVINSAEYC